MSNNIEMSRLDYKNVSELNDKPYKIKGLAIFIIISLVILFLLYSIVNEKNGDEWFKSLEMYDWGKQVVIIGTMLFISLLLFSWGCFYSYSTIQDRNKRNIIIFGYGLVLLGLMGLFGVFFRKDSEGNFSNTGFSISLIFSLFTSLITLSLFFPMWENKQACLSLLPFLLWILVITILISQIYYKNK